MQLDSKALNKAGWKFIEMWDRHTDAKMPQVIWNNCKMMMEAVIEEYLNISAWPRTHATFRLGDLVEKKRGSTWHGRIVGWYATQLTPEGYAVESIFEHGSVQIYPAAALQKHDPEQDLVIDIKRSPYLSEALDTQFGKAKLR